MVNTLTSNNIESLNLEIYLTKLFKGKHTGTKINYCNIETNNYLIEVKSCNLFNKNNKMTQLGRYFIDTNNHITLFLKAIQKNKIPIYIFVLKINNYKIIKKVTWDLITINNTKDYSYIKLNKIFYKK